MEQVLFEVKRVIVGQDRLLERVLIALLARGHLLVEGMPGLAKTLTVNTLAQVLQAQFKRIQFTPDLMPADLIGSRIFHPRDAAFQTLLGPVFANLLLADEINRAPPKVQSALLEAMQEGQVTIAGQSHPLPKPFVVMATQNPIETEGTYPLPEAQVDRFMMKIIIDYPNADEEFVVVQRVIGAPQQAQPVISHDELLHMQSLCKHVYVDPSLIRYAVSLSAASRHPGSFGLATLGPMLMHGASPRASIWMIEAARALAALRARAYVLPEDVIAVAPDVLRHRISLSDEALASQVDTEQLLKQFIAAVPAPVKPLGS
ncbi:MAG: MoxR family ATPase [Betaproteobacteria bacterium]|nr:MoxR family ATPase [Betaproteobacteria bacterium]